MSFLFFLENFCKRHVHPVLLHPFSKTIPYSQVRILPTNLAHRISLKSSYTLRSVQECMRLETDSNIVPRRSRGTNTSVFLLNGTVQHKPFNLQTLNWPITDVQYNRNVTSCDQTLQDLYPYTEFFINRFTLHCTSCPSDIIVKTTLQILIFIFLSFFSETVKTWVLTVTKLYLIVFWVFVEKVPSVLHARFLFFCLFNCFENAVYISVILQGRNGSEWRTSKWAGRFVTSTVYDASILLLKQSMCSEQDALPTGVRSTILWCRRDVS